jgi:heavy metal sensor kinase
VLALGLLGGGWLAGRVLRPVREISDAATKIATGNLAERIRTADTDSELGELAAILNATFARLEAAFAQQARFTADAAHELRTPVSVILTHVDNALAEPCASEGHAEAFAACRRAAQRMRRLIQSLLELSRLDAGQETLRREPLDLAAVAHESVELLRPLAEARGVALRLDLASARCAGDPDRLAQVVANLVGNAIQHHGPAAGAVTVATRCDEHRVGLSVTDDGPGIPPEHLPRIFERFYRIDAARAGGAEHSGLGLAIAKAIVDAHGGEIAAANLADGGARFTVTLPVG